MAILGKNTKLFFFLYLTNQDPEKEIFTAIYLGLRKYPEKNHSPVRNRQKLMS